MTMPTPPATVGAQPINADTVNNMVGNVLRQFLVVKGSVGQDQAWLATVNLQDPPYGFSADQETLLKTAINGLDAAFDGIDMTFINRLIGLA